MSASAVLTANVLAVGGGNIWFGVALLVAGVTVAQVQRRQKRRRP